VPPLEGYEVDLGETFPPKGCEPIDISDSTCGRWGMKWGEDIGDSYKTIFLDMSIVQDEVDKRGVACDFYTSAKKLKKYSLSDKLLLIMAPDRNELDVSYLWAYTKDAYEAFSEKIRLKEEELKAAHEVALAEAKQAAKAAAAENGEVLDDEDEFPEDMTIDTTYEDKPLIARPYEETGTSLEVEKMQVTNTRPLLGFYISQQRKKFSGRCEFADSEVDKPPYYNHQKTTNHTLRRAEVDMGFQCSAGQADQTTQTLWRVKYNKACQYEPIGYTDKLKDKIMKSEKMHEFLAKSIDMIELNLQHNETLDLFKGEFAEFEDEEFSLGNKKENNLKPWHSFTDLTYSKNRIISEIQWHPTKSGVVAFSCTNNLTFNQWVEVSGMVLSSSILIWNFNDLLHPQYILMAPGDLSCFAFNPKNPNIIVGGMMTGQLVLWDLTEYNRKLENQLGKKDADKDWAPTPPISPIFISSIDRSHSRRVTCIKWLSANSEINKRGEYSVLDESAKDYTHYPNQFITVAGDGHLLYWDARPHKWKNPNWATQEKKDGIVTWLPHASVALTNPGASGTICATKIESADGTNVVMVTEDGEVAVVNWASKSADEKKSAVTRINKSHVSACTAVCRSPHFPNMFMTVGDWTFTIWQLDEEGMQEPVFVSSPASHQLTTGCWSPSRPGLMVVARADGTIEVWDLLDQCHKPSLMFPSGSEGITSMKFWQSNVGAQQYLAVGDNEGKLHIIEIPRNMRKPIPHENQLMQQFYNREIKRVAYAKNRRGIRSNEKKPVAAEEEAPEGEGDAAASGGGVGGILDVEESKEEREAEERYQRQLKSWTEKLNEMNDGDEP